MNDDDENIRIEDKYKLTLQVLEKFICSWSPLPDLNRGQPDVCCDVFFQLQSGALPTELSEASHPKQHHYLIIIKNLT